MLRPRANASLSFAALWVPVLAASLAIGCGGGGSAGPHGDASDSRVDVSDHPAPQDRPSAELDTGGDLGAAPDAAGVDRVDATAVADAASADLAPADAFDPRPPIELACTTDTIDPLQPEVFLPLGSLAGGAVPLCSGWVMITMQTPAALVYRNVIDGRWGASIPLPGTPGRLAVDFDRDAAYVALPSRSSLARVDLQAGAVTEVKVAAQTASVALGNGGLVFVTEQPYSSPSGLAVIDMLKGTVLYDNANFPTTDMAFDQTNNQLVTLLSGLTRSRFDPTAMTLTQLENPFGLCGAGNGVVLSGDGRHVLSSCPPGSNSVSGDFYDLSLSSLTTVLGQFMGMTGPAAFSPDSATLAAVGATVPAPVTLKIADVATHTVSSTTEPGFDCAAALVDSIAWSRGAKMIHMLVGCGGGAPSALYAVQAR